MFNRHSWISSTIFYAAFLLLPILLYVFFYQSSRIDEATARNFRSLGAAADRIEQALDTFDKYSKNYSLGVDSTLLTDFNNACEGRDVTWLGISEELLDVVKEAKDQSAIKDKELKVKAVRRRPWPYIRGCRIGQFKSNIKECKHGVRFEQGKLTSHDCRGLREREPRVYNALKPTKDDKDEDNEIKGGRALIEILDQFGMEVSMDTKKAFQKPTQHLSVFFDNYFIANENGDVVFANEHSPVSHDEHRRHRAGVPFASLSSIKDLLLDNTPSPLALFGPTGEPNAHLNTVPTPIGHSTVRHIQVDDIDLSVFIHPFTASSSKLYVVGAVLSSSLADEAIRLRLGPAADATLAIALLLTLLPIIRFWTAGDRSIFRRLNLYSMGASALVASALSAALLSAVILKSVDGEALDLYLEQIGNAITRKFGEQFATVKGGLCADFLKMDAIDKDSQTPCTQNDVAESSIGRKIFCPSICPSTNPPRELSEFWSMAGPCKSARSVSRGPSPQWWPTSSYILDSEGKRAVCTQYRNDLPLSLDLRFRDYFLDAERGKVGLYRIDSVVRGRQQIVASSVYGEEDGPKGGRVAVAIPRFLSVDGTVLPPPFQYAVFDQSGNTIFHSDEDRINVSNFVDDTGNDARIRAAISYKEGKILDLDYDGISVRGYVKRLHEDVDWTLVVFRTHSLVDRISALAISLSVMSWLFTTLMIFLACALLAFVPRPHGQALLPAAISSSTSVPVGVTGVALGILGLAISYSRGPALVVVGLFWPITMAAAIYVVAWWRLIRTTDRGHAVCEPVKPKRHGRPIHWTKEIRRIYDGMLDAEEQLAWTKVLTLTSVILSFSVVPMLSWHTYFRAELSDGLAAHLLIEAEGAVQSRKKEYDLYAKEMKDKTLVSPLESFLEDGVIGFEKGRPFLEDEEARDESAISRALSFCFGKLWPLLAYSPVTQQTMWYRSKGVTSWSIRSVSDAVGHAIGNSSDEDELPIGAERLFVIVLGATLILFACYSLVRTKFGFARSVGQLRSFSSMDDVESRSEPMHLLLIKRSEHDVRRMVEEMGSFYAVKSLRWDSARMIWDDVIGKRSDTVFEPSVAKRVHLCG